MRSAAWLVVAAVLGVGAAPPLLTETKKDLARLQGTWEMEALEVNGEEVPAKRLQGTTLTIRGDRYIVKVKDTSHEVTFKLDATPKPKAIDMYLPDGVEVPKLSKGVYELDGDTFRLCRHQMAGEDRPTQLGTWANTNLFLVTWRRKQP